MEEEKVEAIDREVESAPEVETSVEEVASEAPVGEVAA